MAAISPERLYKMRRMRKARRLFKQQPLFAFVLMRQEYNGYAYGDFLDDVRRRSKRRPKRPKSTLNRYGRYGRMLAHLRHYEASGDWEQARCAFVLRERMRQPYRVWVNLRGDCWEYSISPLVNIAEVERLTENLRSCTSLQEVEALIDRVRSATA